MPAHPTLFIRREAYARVGRYDPSYRIAGDFELCVRLFAEQGIRYAYLPEVLVRMPRGGLSNSGWRSKWMITAGDAPRLSRARHPDELRAAVRALPGEGRSRSCAMAAELGRRAPRGGHRCHRLRRSALVAHLAARGWA